MDKEKIIRDELISKFTEIVDQRLMIASSDGDDGLDKAYNEINHSLSLMQSVVDFLFHKK